MLVREDVSVADLDQTRRDIGDGEVPDLESELDGELGEIGELPDRLEYVLANSAEKAESRVLLNLICWWSRE